MALFVLLILYPLADLINAPIHGQMGEASKL